MSEHVVSVYPVTVEPTEDDPRTVGWRWTCTCQRSIRFRRAIWDDRDDVERIAREHLRAVGCAPETKQAGHTRLLGDEVATDSGQSETEAL